MYLLITCKYYRASLFVPYVNFFLNIATLSSRTNKDETSRSEHHDAHVSQHEITEKEKKDRTGNDGKKRHVVTSYIINIDEIKKKFPAGTKVEFDHCNKRKDPTDHNTFETCPHCELIAFLDRR